MSYGKGEYACICQKMISRWWNAHFFHHMMVDATFFRPTKYISCKHIHKLFESNILQNISDISQNISSISQLYLKFIANISQQYHKYISNISQLYLNYISIISQVHLNYFQKHFNYISNTSQTYLEYVSNKSQLYLTGSTTAWPPFGRFLAAFNGWRCSPAPDSCPLCTTSWGEQFKHIQFTHSIHPITHP